MSSSRGKSKKRVFLCRKSVKVKKGKVIPASFLKIEERETFDAEKFGKRGTVKRVGR